ncbi:MAG: hypothetical protein Q6K99_05365 [Thermostichales cyanobacterium BF4_bins_65]
MDFVDVGQGLIINLALVARVTYEQVPLPDGSTMLEVTIYLAIPNQAEKEGLVKYRLSGYSASRFLTYLFARTQSGPFPEEETPSP